LIAMNKNRTVLLLFLICGLSLASSCSRGSMSTYKKTKPLMDTVVSITVVSGSGAAADQAIDRAFAAIDRFGSLIDFFSDKSELTLINRNAGIKPTVVSPDTADVIEKAVSVSKRSWGAFDATIGPVSRLWDFHEKIRPDDGAIKKYLPLVGYRDIIIDRQKSTVFLRKKGMLMDLGGIAKGYAADLAVDSLRQAGIAAGIVAVAGDIRTFGTKPDGEAWNIGIKNPRQKGESDDVLAEIRLSGKAVSTAGDYERFFIEKGRRYHHLLDPKTGYPAEGCRSVTVIADRGVYSDAFSTAVFILGPEKGMSLLREAGMEGVIVDNNGTIRPTPGLKGRLKIEKNS